MTPRTLELAGHGGTALPCVLWEAEAAAASALVLPGGARAGNRLGTTPARPDLHYTRALLLELGVSVLELWWDAGAVPPGGEEEAAWLEDNARAGARAASEAAPLRVLVGRSFGTLGLAKLVLQGEWHETATVWIAPLLRAAEVRRALEDAAASAFVVGGTADEYFDPAAVAEVQSRGATLALVEGGNHVLDVGGAADSARALADVLEAMRSFLERRLAP